VIPGSAIRGMLRNLVAIISDSALVTDPRSVPVFRAVAARRPARRLGDAYRSVMQDVRAGYLHEGRDGEWIIQPARGWPEKGPRQHTFSHTSRTPPSRGASPDVTMLMTEPRADDRGGLPWTEPAIGGRGWGGGEAVRVATAGVRDKACDYVIHPQDDDATSLRVPEAVRRAYRDDASMTRNGPTGRLLSPPTWGGQSPPSFGVACFYVLDSSNTVAGLGGTLFFRIPGRPYRDFAPPPRARDMARRIFGAVLIPAVEGESRTGSEDAEADEVQIAPGHVACEDLRLDGVAGRGPFLAGSQYQTTRTALASPKPTCVQNYLGRADRKLATYLDDPATAARLRGFKLYPHNPQRVQAELVPLSDDWRHRWRDDKDQVITEVARSLGIEARQAAGAIRARSVIRPVAEGVTFTGRIRFTDLHAAELGALLVALQLRPDMRHKLGMARALGLGSVRVQVRQVTVTGTDSASSLFSEDGEGFAQDEARLDPESERCAAWKREFFRWITGTPKADESSFWKLERMAELEAILRWDTLIAPQCLATRPYSDPSWSERRLLPRAGGLPRIGNPRWAPPP
jgi:CRISPR-associated protein (TIGR03986 family)